MAYRGAKNFRTHLLPYFAVSSPGELANCVPESSKLCLYLASFSSVFRERDGSGFPYNRFLCLFFWGFVGLGFF